MSTPARSRSYVATFLATIIVSALAAVFLGAVSAFPTGRSEALRADRVVLFTMPGVSWGDIRATRTPILDKLTGEGATAAMAPRTASSQPSTLRGYVTLGAGNRAQGTDPDLLRPFPSGAEVRSGLTADDILESTVGRHRKGEIVVTGVPRLQRSQLSTYHGTVVGALGEALTLAGMTRGVVSAADRSPTDGASDTDGSPLLAIADTNGVIDTGTISGLVELAPGEAFGVRTKPKAFDVAVRRALARSRVVLVDGGETLRADEFSLMATPERAEILRKRALERTDALLGSVVDVLGRKDLLLVISPSSRSGSSEHLSVAIAWGSDVRPGVLTSPSTRRGGIVALTDVAPTVLSAVGVVRSDAMSGRAIGRVPADIADRARTHDELDLGSAFRERFSPAVFYAFIALFVALSVLVGLVFLVGTRSVWALTGLCYVILAVPLATFVLNPFLWRLSPDVAHVVAWGGALALAAVAWLLPGPRWLGAIILLIATATFMSVDLLGGADLLVNAVFGNSLIAAGRFYGLSNLASAIYFGAAVLGVSGVAELGVGRRASVRLAVLLAVVVLIGLPPFGADFGGLLTGIAAVGVTVAIANGQVRWRQVVGVVIAAVLVTAAVSFLDSLRSPEQQTHLGRFFALVTGDPSAAALVVRRKAAQTIASLGFSRFTWVIPLGIAALAVLLRRPAGPLREVLPSYPVIRAGLIGLLVAGGLGFALNDSGVAIPAILLAQAVPVLVLLSVDRATG